MDDLNNILVFSMLIVYGIGLFNVFEGGENES